MTRTRNELLAAAVMVAVGLLLRIASPGTIVALVGVIVAALGIAVAIRATARLAHRRP